MNQQETEQEKFYRLQNEKLENEPQRQKELRQTTGIFLGCVVGAVLLWVLFIIVIAKLTGG